MTGPSLWQAGPRLPLLVALTASAAAAAVAVYRAATGKHAEAGHPFLRRLAHEIAVHPVADLSLLLLLAFGDRWFIWFGRLGMLRLIMLFFGVELLCGAGLVIASVNDRVTKNPSAPRPAESPTGPGDGLLLGLSRRLAFLAKMQPVVFFSVLLLAAFPPLTTCVALQDPPDSLFANLALSVFYLLVVGGCLAWILTSIPEHELAVAESRRISWGHWTEHVFFTFFGVLSLKLLHGVFGSRHGAAPRRGDGPSGGGGSCGQF